MADTWQPIEPPTLDVDGTFCLDGWKAGDASALRRFDLDPDTARFFGWTLEEAAAAPASHYDGPTRADANRRAWQEGRELNLAIRRRSSGEAVGWVELQPPNDGNVSYMVQPDQRGQGLAARAVDALLAWASAHIGLARATIVCHVENAASRRVAEKCGFTFLGRDGHEYRFSLSLNSETGGHLAGGETVTLDELADLVITTNGERDTGRSWVVAIDGWSGSGKTSLADRLAPALSAPCIHLDDWVPGWSGLARSVDLLVEWVLTPLSEGKPARWRLWDWARDEWGEERAQNPAPLILVEGCGSGAALARPWLSELLWLDATAAQRDARLRARSDWPTYEPWAAMWAAQEAALRDGDDVAGAADLIVQAPDTGSSLRVCRRL